MAHPFFAGQIERIMILWEYQGCGYERYRYASVGETCDECTALDGEIFALNELRPGVNVGPLHPNCDCRVDILDHTGAVVFSFLAGKKDENEERYQQNLNMKQTPFTVWMDMFELASQTVKQSVTDLWHAINNQFTSPYAFFDWLTMGALSANAERGKKAFDKPTIYNIGNWLTSGTFDKVKGAIDPEEPLSLQHWLDSLQTVLMGLDIYRMGTTVVPKVKKRLLQKQVVDDVDNVILNTDDIVYDSRSVDKAFEKHGQDFGIYPDGSNASKSMFVNDINFLVKHGTHKNGYYRTIEDIHIYDHSTHQWAFFNKNGNFVTAFKLSPQQFEYLSKTGVVK